MKNFVAYVRSVLRNRAFMNVLAEEPTEPNNEPNNQGGNTDPQDPPTNTQQNQDPKPNGNVNFEDLIAKARKDEREKLYPDLTKAKEKVNNLLLVIEERDQKISGLESENEKLKKDYSKLEKDLKDGTKTNKTVSELTATISTLENQLEKLQVDYETDVQSLKLESFKKEQIASAGGEIIPELVMGSTEEEITASIEKAKQRYAEISQKAIGNVQLPRTNPSATQINLKEKSMDEIAQMTPQQWAEYRKELQIK
jgi:predicted RNase H-like nuclease (RuvC/YqgF family)